MKAVVKERRWFNGRCLDEGMENLRRVRAISLGPEATSITRQHGSVIAVLSNAVYLEGVDGSILSIVDARAADGPLTLRVDGLGRLLDKLAKGDVGVPFRGVGNTLRIDGKVDVDLREARPWTPARVVTLVDGPGREAALDELRAALRSPTSKGEIGALVASLPAQTGVEKSVPASGDALAGSYGIRLQRLVRAVLDRDAGAASDVLLGFLGLGPGLTPSGDDFVAGFLAVSAWTEARGGWPARLARELRPKVESVASKQTTRLSARLLHHASKGVLYEPAMDLGAALLAGESIKVRPATHRLFSIGHTSGTDLAAGLMVGAMSCAEPPTLEEP
jgi:hypothetical protein